MERGYSLVGSLPEAGASIAAGSMHVPPVSMGPTILAIPESDYFAIMDVDARNGMEGRS